MLYNVTFLYDEYVAETTVSCKSTAKFETLARKIASEVYKSVKGQVPITTKFHYQKPNIWTNGGFPTMWFEMDASNPVGDVIATREDGMKVFIL